MMDYQSNSVPSSAAALVQLAAYRIDLPTQKLGAVLERMQEESIQEEFQLRFLQIEEWTALGAPIGLRSAVRAYLQDSQSTTTTACSSCGSSTFCGFSTSFAAEDLVVQTPRETPKQTLKKVSVHRSGTISPRRNSDDKPTCPTKNDIWSNLKISPKIKTPNVLQRTGLNVDSFLVQTQGTSSDNDAEPEKTMSDTRGSIDLRKVANVLLEGKPTGASSQLTSISEGKRSSGSSEGKRSSDAPQIPKRLESLAQLAL